jgi:hypothetical protein
MQELTTDEALARVTELIHRYCESEDSILEEYRHPQLDRFIKEEGWREVLHQLPTEKRVAYRYYLSHVKGECCFDTATITKIEAIVALLEANAEAERSQRWIVHDQINNLWWASVIEPPFFRGKRYSFLFEKKDLDYIKELVDNTNKKLGRRQLVIEKIDASKRLKKSL